MSRKLTIILGASLLGALFVIGYMFYRIGEEIAQPEPPPEPPIHYTQDEYLPARAIYAPGQTMIYSPTLIIRTPGRVDVFRSFWNRDKDANAALCSGQPAPTISVSRNFPATTLGNVRGGSRVQVLIPPLPPGRYWLLSSAVGPDGGQSMYQVPFVIAKQC